MNKVASRPFLPLLLSILIISCSCATGSSMTPSPMSASPAPDTTTMTMSSEADGGGAESEDQIREDLLKYIQSLKEKETPPAPAEALNGWFLFSAGINKNTVVASMNALETLAAAGKKNIVIEINTEGGELMAGFLLAKAIEEYPGHVTCVVDQLAASEGFYILQSCETRVMTQRALLMAHEPMIGLGDGHLNGRALREVLTMQQNITRSWAVHASARMKVSTQEFLEKIDQGDWWLDAKTALQLGAVDRLVDSTKVLKAELAAANTSASSP